MNNIFRENAIETLIETIKDYSYYLENDLDSIFSKAFNEFPFYVFRTDAIRDLEEYGTYKAIYEVKEYEEQTIGETITDFLNPERVAEMILYINGEELVFGTLQDIVEENERNEKETETEYAERIIELFKSRI